jgi:hypothetical protein
MNHLERLFPRFNQTHVHTGFATLRGLCNSLKAPEPGVCWLDDRQLSDWASAMPIGQRTGETVLALAF